LLAGPRSFPAQLVRKKAREAGTASGTERAFSLRRTWRSLAMDLGIDHAVARLSLGHAGLEGVEGVYGHSQMVEQRAQSRRARRRGPRSDPAWRSGAGRSAARTVDVEGRRT
jgi:hypothetical protein